MQFCGTNAEEIGDLCQAESTVRGMDMARDEVLPGQHLQAYK